MLPDGGEICKAGVMSHSIRIILGVVVLIGTFLTRQKVSAALGGDGGGVVTIFSQEMSMSSLSLILGVFAILGVVLIVLGVVGLIKANK